MKSLIVNGLRYTALLFLICTSSGFVFAQTNLTSQGLVTIMQPVKTWPGSEEIDAGHGYNSSDWSNIVQAAKVIQKSDPKSVEKALKDWEEGKITELPRGGGNMQKLFLTIRVVFDLPEHAPPSKGYSEIEANRDGTINLAWPIVWNSGRPRIIKGLDSYNGGIWPLAWQFHQFNERYKFRNLSECHP